MTKTSLTGKKNLFIISIILIVSIIAIGIGTAALSNIHINTIGSNIYTDQDLVCYWTINETTNANITWYRNGVQNITASGINCTANNECWTNASANVPNQYTTKGDQWTCAVAHYNGTGTEIGNTTITIADTVPTYPQLFYMNGTRVNNVTIPNISEDFVSQLFINSSDADNDPIKYVIAANSINCTIDAASGLITCAPTEEYQIGIFSVLFRAEDNNTGATRGYVNASINVTPTNDPPTFLPALASQTRYENQALNYTITGIDPENNTPFLFTITSYLSDVYITNISSMQAIIRFNNSGQDITPYWDRGNHTINVTIGDSDPIHPKNTTASFVLQVIPLNHPPNLSLIPNQGGIQGGSLLLYFNATDIDNDTLNFYSNDSLYNVTTVSNSNNASGVTFAIGMINITSLTNDHVIHQFVSIGVSDSKENVTQGVFFNITNVNDPPIIYPNSSDSGNFQYSKGLNYNIDNLTAYTGVPLQYQVNATDPDIATYAGDTITFTSNNSAIPINTSSGIITVQLNSTGTYAFMITVTDTHGLQANHTGLLTVLPNTPPGFTQIPLPLFSCFEYDAVNNPMNCTYNLSQYANDSDPGDYVAAYTTNSTIFIVNDSTGIITLQANQSEIGVYTIRVNITDTRGGTNITTFAMIINNTNNPPTISQIQNDFGFATRITKGVQYNYIVSADDLDLGLANSTENLTFNVTISGPNPNLFSIVKSQNTSGITQTGSITFTPGANDDGAYNISITATDTFHNQSTTNFNITVYNTTLAPNITAITPYAEPYAYWANTSWRNTSDFTGAWAKQTLIHINENESYTFNTTAVLDAQYANTAHYYWYLNGTLVSTNQTYTKYFDFFSARVYNLTAVVADDFGKSDSFLWNISVTNVPRPPILENNLTNLSVNGTTTYSNYFIFTDGKTRFIEPDDDLNSNGIIDGNETSTLTFGLANSNYSCTYANFTFIGADLQVTARGIGVCAVTFKAINAEDPTVTTSSNEVLINVTAITNNSISEQIIYVPRGGGGTTTQTVTIPVPKEVDKPHPLQIISPGIVTIYRNDTVKVPITLNNTWNTTLEGITLRAEVNAPNVTVYLDQEYISRLARNETKEITAVITNYKSEGHYEIKIIGNVTNPSYEDTATIFVDAAEMRSEGDAADSKISFARDLLSSNPECLELNELLNEAKKQVAAGQYAQAGLIIDNVITGCKYLVSNVNKNVVEKPNKDFIQRFEWQQKYTDYTVIGAFGLIFVIAAVYIFRKKTPEENF